MFNFSSARKADEQKYFYVHPVYIIWHCLIVLYFL